MKKEPTLGEIIKEERIAQRFTQEEIAERIGCHPQYYKNLEKPDYEQLRSARIPFLRNQGNRKNLHSQNTQ